MMKADAATLAKASECASLLLECLPQYPRIESLLCDDDVDLAIVASALVRWGVAWQQGITGDGAAAIEAVRHTLAARRGSIAQSGWFSASSATLLLPKIHQYLADRLDFFQLLAPIEGALVAIPHFAGQRQERIGYMLMMECFGAEGKGIVPGGRWFDVAKYVPAGYLGLFEVAARPFAEQVRTVAQMREDLTLPRSLRFLETIDREALAAELELEYAGLVDPADLSSPHGPRPPDQFVWKEGVIKDLSLAAYRILDRLWGNGSMRPVEIDELVVWYAKDRPLGDPAEACRKAWGRAQLAVETARVGLALDRTNNHLQLLDCSRPRGQG